ncbi:hypothetical protein ACWEGQ_23995 [Streptomyces seoulensis]
MRATIAVVEDCVMEDLDPKGVTDVVAKLRGKPIAPIRLAQTWPTLAPTGPRTAK